MGQGLIAAYISYDGFHTSLEEEIKARSKNSEKPITDADFFAGMTEEERRARVEQFKSEMSANTKRIKSEIKNKLVLRESNASLRSKLIRSYNRILAYNRENDDAIEVDEIPDPSRISWTEQRRRRSVGNRWREKMENELVDLNAQISSTGVFCGRSVHRETQAFLCGGTMEEMEKRCEIIRSGTPEEKKALFEERMDEVLDFVEEFQEYKSDEDFLRALEGKRHMLAIFGELDKPDPLLSDFGIGSMDALNPELAERWRSLTDIGVTLSALQMRVDHITSPAYPTINPDEVTAWENLLSNVRAEGAEEEIGIPGGDAFSDREAFNAIRTKEGKTFNPLACDFRSYAFENPEYKKSNQIKDHVDFVLKSRFGKTAEEAEFFGPNGEKITDREALHEALYRGDTVKVCGEGILPTELNVPRHNGYVVAQLGKPQAARDLTPEDVRTYVQSLGAMDAGKERMALKNYAMLADAYDRHSGIYKLFHPAMGRLVEEMKRALTAARVAPEKLALSTQKGRKRYEKMLKSKDEMTREFNKARRDPERLKALAADLKILAGEGKFSRDLAFRAFRSKIAGLLPPAPTEPVGSRPAGTACRKCPRRGGEGKRRADRGDRKRSCGAGSKRGVHPRKRRAAGFRARTAKIKGKNKGSACRAPLFTLDRTAILGYNKKVRKGGGTMTPEEIEYRGTVNRLAFSLWLFLGLFGIFSATVTLLELYTEENMTAAWGTVVYQTAYGLLYAFVFLFPVFFFKLVSGRRRQPIRLARRLPREFPLLMLMGIAVVSAAAYFNAELVEIFHYHEYTDRVMETVSVSQNYELVLQFFSLCVVPAFVEELLFRGVIVSNLLPYGRGTAVLGGALLFGLMHQNAGQFLYATAAGVALGLIYLYTDSLWACILTHFCNNFFSLLEGALYDRLPPEESTMVSSILELSILAAGIAAGVCFFRGLRDRRAATDTEDHFGEWRAPTPERPPCTISPRRRVRLFFSIPMIVFILACVLEMAALLILPRLL